MSPPGVRGPRGLGPPQLVDAAALLPTPPTRPRVDFEEEEQIEGPLKRPLEAAAHAETHALSQPSPWPPAPRRHGTWLPC